MNKVKTRTEQRAGICKPEQLFKIIMTFMMAENSNILREPMYANVGVRTSN